MTENVRGQFPIAVYGDPGLPEYRSNPLISALPPIMDIKQVGEQLRRRPAFHDEEKNLSPGIRVHAIARVLTDFFQPLSVHLELESKISLLIRSGYKGRNPANGDYYTHLQNGYERLVKGDFQVELFDSAISTAHSLSLIGCSGCGKSTALNTILRTYPQAIFHPDYNITQLVYLKLDCPYNGNLKSLCIEFFMAVDRVLHTNYTRKYVQKRLSIPTLMFCMAQVATLHAIGILIIDEIQHLNEAKSGGEKDMLNFFVTLTNIIGIPVVMVGTPKARQLFEADLRSARRSAGMGSLYWDRLPRDRTWSAFISKLWQYQWLQRGEPLSDEIETVVYEYSQGVIDIAVKLFVLSQHRAIVTRAERITPKLLQTVYEDELKPVHPMLAALRSGKLDEIAKYGDLHVPDITQKLLVVTQEINEINEAAQPKVVSDDKAKKLVALLVDMGVEQDIAIASVDHILAESPNLPVATLIHKLTSFTVSSEQKVFSQKSQQNAVKRVDWETLSTPDLRYIFSQKEKERFYDIARKKNIIFDWKMITA